MNKPISNEFTLNVSRTINILSIYFQARYRQYFEEEPDPNMDAGMIPIETQVLMQEVLTDGMAFCSLM